MDDVSSSDSKSDDEDEDLVKPNRPRLKKGLVLAEIEKCRDVDIISDD